MEFARYSWGFWKKLLDLVKNRVVNYCCLILTLGRVPMTSVTLVTWAVVVVSAVDDRGAVVDDDAILSGIPWARGRRCISCQLWSSRQARQRKLAQPASHSAAAVCTCRTQHGHSSGQNTNTNTQTNIQTDKQTNGQTHKHSNKRTNKHSNKQAYKHSNKQTDKKIKQTNKQTDKHINTLRNKRANTQTNNQTN